MALPDISRLLAILNTSGISSKQNPLYQTLFELIKAVQQSNKEFADKLGISSSGNSSTLDNKTYLTVNNELVSLPNSRKLLAGSNVSFDDSVGGERTIDVGLNQVILTGANEAATLPNSRRLLAGTNISFDDSVANQRTVNVDNQDDYVVMSDGANPPSPVDDGNGNFIYIPYIP
jgi:hypothetical protein